MSTRLRISCNGHDLALWQTPTHITNMCLMDEDGVSGEATGDSARRAVNCYLEWVYSRLSAAYNSQGDYEQHRRVVLDHMHYVKQEVAESRAIVAYRK